MNKPVKATPVKQKLKVAAPKQKAVSKKKTQPEVRASSLLLQASLSNAREEYNDSEIAAVGDLSSLTIGVEIPFALQYVLQNNSWPLGRIVELVGMEKSNKSGLAFELVRLFDLAQGSGYLFENETKYNDKFAQSIIGYQDELGRVVLGHFPCKSQEDWQAKLTGQVRGVKQMMLKGITEKRKGKLVRIAKPIGRTVPILYILDSLAGGVAEENVNKIEKKGFAGRNHPAEALSNTMFFKKFRSDLVKWPFSMVVVNHLRKQKAENGPHIERKTPGGKHMGFQETFQLELSKVRDIKVVDSRPNAVTMYIKGNRLKIQCRKSSMGEQLREIEVDLLWWYDRVPGVGVRQYSKWQWEAATIDLLQSFESGAAQEKIRAIVDLHNAKEGKLWSRALGVPKEAPLAKADIGAKLEANKKIMEQLSDLFAIHRQVTMKPGDDYRKLVAANSARVRKEMEK